MCVCVYVNVCIQRVIQVNLPAVPVFVSVSGLLDVEYRLAVACRNGVVHMVKNGQLLSTSIELEAQVMCYRMCSLSIECVLLV